MIYDNYCAQNLVAINTFYGDKKFNLGITSEITRDNINKYNDALNKHLKEYNELRSTFVTLDNDIKVKYMSFQPISIDVIKTESIDEIKLRSMNI